MTHLFDTSATLANIFGEPGMERVRSLVKDPGVTVGISVLTLYETDTAVLNRTGSESQARDAVAILRASVDRLVPVD